MSNKLAEIRAKLQALDNKASGNKSGGDNTNYPFWNIATDGQARIRFLPDADPENTFFWVEKQVIKLPFPGIKGDDENKQVWVQVPCVEMWGDQCPVHQEIRPWFNDETLKDTARTYWKKRSYIFQGLVVDSSLTEDSVPENPIRRFVIGSQIFKLIKSSLLDPDFEYIPTDYENGTDFIIAKTSKGGYADYSTSKWARRESALDQDQLAMVEGSELQDLKSSLPRKPSAEELNIIFEMFEASVEGELYDPSKFGKYYRPFGFEYQETNSPAKTEEKTTPAKVDVKLEAAQKALADDEDEPSNSAPAEEESAPSSSSTSGKSAQEILSMIRNRK